MANPCGSWKHSRAVSPPSLSSLARRSDTVIPAEELQRFLDTFLYQESAVLLDEITRLDPEAGRVRALLDTTRTLFF